MTQDEINEYLRLKPDEESKLVADTIAQAPDPGFTDRLKRNVYEFQQRKVRELQKDKVLPLGDSDD